MSYDPYNPHRTSLNDLARGLGMMYNDLILPWGYRFGHPVTAARAAYQAAIRRPTMRETPQQEARRERFIRILAGGEWGPRGKELIEQKIQIPDEDTAEYWKAVRAPSGMNLPEGWEDERQEDLAQQEAEIPLSPGQARRYRGVPFFRKIAAGSAPPEVPEPIKRSFLTDIDFINIPLTPPSWGRRGQQLIQAGFIPEAKPGKQKKFISPAQTTAQFDASKSKLALTGGGAGMHPRIGIGGKLIGTPLPDEDILTRGKKDIESIQYPQFGEYVDLVSRDAEWMRTKNRLQRNQYNQAMKNLTPMDIWKKNLIGGILGEPTFADLPEKPQDEEEIMAKWQPRKWEAVRLKEETERQDAAERRKVIAGLYSKAYTDRMRRDAEIATQAIKADESRFKAGLKAWNDHLRSQGRSAINQNQLAQSLIVTRREYQKNYANLIMDYRKQLKDKLPDELTPQEKEILALTPDQIQERADKASKLSMQDLLMSVFGNTPHPGGQW